MNKRRLAVIDLGTNTFHLMICEVTNDQSKTIFKRRIPVKIGQGGITQGVITDAARARALSALIEFKKECTSYQVKEIHALATSAIRSASNGQAFCYEVLQETGIEINVIDGLREAEFIFAGVKTAINIGSKPCLIMDIGGGSVEFILATTHQILFQKSYEIGAQRLKDKFHHKEPIAATEISDLEEFLQESLSDLIAIARVHPPTTLIGASGSFETVVDIYNQKQVQKSSRIKLGQQFPIDHFKAIHQEFITKDQGQRLQIPGMIPMRVDMICVASALINFIIAALDIRHINVSSAALKEGLLVSLLEPVSAD